MLWGMLLRPGEKLSYSGIAGELWPKRKSYESPLKSKSYEFRMYSILRSEGFSNRFNGALDARISPMNFNGIYKR